MAFELMKVLLETPTLAEQGMELQQPKREQLLNDPTFQKIAKVAPEFAKKLVFAWDGDMHAWAQSRGKTQDYLFGPTATPQMLQKVQPGVNPTPAWEQAFQQLQKLHQQAFPQLSGREDTSQWGQERWQKESAEFDALEYEILREELIELFGKELLTH